jgi:hypothetical protein
MRKPLSADERGVINTLLIPLILSIVFLLGTAGFALWAFMSRQDYKNNVDVKVRTAVGVAVKETETRKDNEFQEREKQPLATYQGPATSGSIVIKYPKTWSAYVEDAGKGSKPLDGYFHPTKVPGIQSEAAYALRVEVVEQSFADVVKTFDSAVKQGKVRSQTYSPANVTTVVGLRVEGEITPRQQGIMILVPLRDKTIKLYTQSDQFYNDFNNNVLPNFTFTP